MVRDYGSVCVFVNNSQRIFLQKQESPVIKNTLKGNEHISFQFVRLDMLFFVTTVYFKKLQDLFRQ